MTKRRAAARQRNCSTLGLLHPTYLKRIRGKVTGVGCCRGHGRTESISFVCNKDHIRRTTGGKAGEVEFGRVNREGIMVEMGLGGSRVGLTSVEQVSSWMMGAPIVWAGSICKGAFVENKRVWWGYGKKWG